MKPYLTVEVLDKDDIWQQITADVMEIDTQGVGFYQGRERPGLFSAVGRCQITLRNSSRAYNPDVDAVSTALIDCDRRIRVKHVGTSAGKALQTQHSGIGNVSYFSQTVTEAVAATDVIVLSWEARAQFDSQYNTDMVQIITSAENGTATLKTYTNKWATYTLTLVATAIAATITPKFIPYPTGITTNAKVVEYRNVTLKKNGGANLLVNGDFATGAVSPWAATDDAAAAGTAATYDNANQDQDVNLAVLAGTGGYIYVYSATNDAWYSIGRSGGFDKQAAQSFQVTAGGYFDRFTCYLWGKSGSPVGDITWELRTDSAGVPGSTILATGTIPAPPSGDNWIQVISSSQPYLLASTTYWIVLKPTQLQGDEVYWIWNGIHTNIYSSGSGAIKSDSTWTAYATDDLFFSVTTLSSTQRDKLAQSFTNSLGVVLTAAKAQLWLKKIGAPAGTLTLRVETDASGAPSGTLYHANATATVAESSLATSYGWIDFTFALSWTVPTTGTLWLVLSTSRSASATDYVAWGADGSSPAYYDGEMLSNVSSAWLTEQKDACFVVVGTAASSTALSVIDDYKIRFNGTIDNVSPSPFALGGDQRCVLTCLDFTQNMRKQMINVTLQENKRGDELLTTIIAFMQTGSLSLTIPGKQVETGKATFPAAFDRYDTQTSILDVVRDICMSEGPFLSFQWFDPDGTFRWASRTFLASQCTLSVPRLTLAGKEATDAPGDPFNMRAVRSNAIRINQAIMTCHPRQTVTGPVVLGKITSPLTIPPIQADGTPGTIQLTLSYRDPTTSRLIGGKNVLTPVATTDYLVNDKSDGTGFNYTNTASFAFSVDAVGGSQMSLTLKNYATGALYVTKLQCRGDMVIVYDPLTITKKHSDVTDNLRLPSPYAADLPFLSDNVLLESLADYIINRYHAPFMEAQQVKVDYKPTLQNVDLLDLEIMDTILVSDPQIGMSSTRKHAITGISYRLITDPGGIAAGSVTLDTMRIDDSTFWILDNATYSVLGSTTRLFV